MPAGVPEGGIDAKLFASDMAEQGCSAVIELMTAMGT
jgi:hypothetical protein